MEIKTETRTVYIVDGEEYATRVDAEVAARTKRLMCILSVAGGPAYDFSVPDAAAALVSQREEIIKILGGTLA